MKKPLNIKAIVVDDEPIALKGVVSLLNTDVDVDVIASFTEASKAIKAINTMTPDVLFLDIQMPKYNGFEVIQHITLKHIPLVVFITAYDEFALKAFNANAVDYLLKPFDDEQFYAMLTKIKKLYKAEKFFKNEQQLLQLLHNIDQNTKNPVALEKKYLERIYIKNFKGVLFLNTDDILWFSADDYYVWVHTKEKKHLIRQTMLHLEKNLDPEKFIRINRSIIIHISHIKKVVNLSQKEYVVFTFSEEQFKISYSRIKNVKKIFNS